MPDFSDFIVFADESGDHSLTSILADYPLFVLALCIFGKEDYAGIAAPAVMRLKFRHFGHDQVILHEHDIRKTRGHFRFLMDAARRPTFYADLNRLMEEAPFTLVALAIHKERYRARHPTPDNPYHIALGFGLELIFQHLRQMGCREGITHMLFETRGSREDAELELEFRRVCEGYNEAGLRFPFELVMVDKRCNSAGLQLADLVARPIGRKILIPEQPNRAFDILAAKFRRGPDGGLHDWGLKVYP